MSFLIPWRLLNWARDNRVLRIRWFGLEAEFAVPPPDYGAGFRAAGAEAVPDAAAPDLPPEAGLPAEERERRRRERERAEADKVLYHSA
ncbi:MAG: hypothetical protein ACHQZQ_08435 [SAR324 cluster bacterium]